MHPGEHRPCESAPTGAGWPLPPDVADVLRDLPTLIRRCDADGNAVHFNQRWLDLRGRTEAQESGHGWLDGVHPEDLASVYVACNSALRRNEPATQRYRLRRADGGYATIIEVVQPTRMGTGTDDRPDGLLSAAVDASGVQGLTPSAPDARPASLLRPVGLIHDLRTLITGVIGQADLAIRFAQDRDPRLGDALAAVAAASRHAELLSNGALRDHAALPDPIDLNAQVRGSEALLRVLVDPRAEMRLDLDPACLRVRMGEAQLSQVLINLVGNASDALRGRDGAITVRTRAVHADAAYLAASRFRGAAEPGLSVLLEIADTGSGMTPDIVARVFEPFFTTKPTGHGIGLAAVLEIVESARGAVEILSEPGSGTAVRLLLPRAEPAAPDLPHSAPSPPSAPREARHTAATVLFVDDSHAVRALAAAALPADGFTVLTAAGGQAAIELAASATPPPGVAVIDDAMPGLNGLETARRLRQRFPAMRLVRSTGGDGRDGDLDPVYDALLLKPYRPSELTILLERLLAE